MTKLRDKIGLQNKIDELYSTVSENQFKLALNKHKAKIGFTDDVNVISALISEFNNYDGNSNIKEFLDYLKSSLNDNRLYIILNENIMRIKSSKNAVSYAKVISILESFLNRDEAGIKEGVYNDLIDYLWISEVKTLVSQVQSACGDEVNVSSFKSKVAYVKEQFQLKSKLEVLYNKIDEGSASRSIIKKYIDMVDKMPQIELIKSLERELRVYEWVDVIKEFKNVLVENVNENSISYLVDHTIRTMESSRGSKSWLQAIDKLREYTFLSESDIRTKVLTEMDEFSWIPPIKNLLKQTQIIEGKIDTTQGGVKVSKVYSPVIVLKENLEGEDEIGFYLNGKAYHVKENNIYPLDKSRITPEFSNCIAVVENFSFRNDAMYFNFKNLSVEIKRIGDNKTETTINGNVVETENIERFLKSSGAFLVNEMNYVNLINFAAKNADKIVELDFVHSIRSNTYKDVVVNVIKLDECIYLNRINPAMITDELIKVKDGSDAVKLVREFVDYDITSFVSDLLTGEEAKKRKYEEDKVMIQERIEYLTSELGKLELVVGINESEELMEAKKLLEESLVEQKKSLNDLYKTNEKANSEYVPGELRIKLEGFNAGTKIKIKADDYTTKGKNENISVILPTEKEIQVTKKFINVTI